MGRLLLIALALAGLLAAPAAAQLDGNDDPGYIGDRPSDPPTVDRGLPDEIQVTVNRTVLRKIVRTGVFPVTVVTDGDATVRLSGTFDRLRPRSRGTRVGARRVGAPARQVSVQADVPTRVNLRVSARARRALRRARSARVTVRAVTQGNDGTLRADRRRTLGR